MVMTAYCMYDKFVSELQSEYYINDN